MGLMLQMFWAMPVIPQLPTCPLFLNGIESGNNASFISDNLGEHWFQIIRPAFGHPPDIPTHPAGIAAAWFAACLEAVAGVLGRPVWVLLGRLPGGFIPLPGL